MANDRSMKTIGHAASLVFADGQRIDYPRYNIAANGFIRGPHNEKIGRGNDFKPAAHEACRKVQQQWMDQFTRFKVPFEGVSVPHELFSVYDTTLRQAKPYSNGKLHLVIKAYWREEPDCYDTITVVMEQDYYRNANFLVTFGTMPLRTIPYEGSVSPFDEFGTITQYYVPIDMMFYWHHRETGNLRALNERLDEALEALESLNGTAYTSMIFSQPIPEIRADIKEWLAGSSQSVKLTPLLKDAAKLFTEMGYNVSDHSNELEIDFRITDNDHEVRITGNSLQVTCLFERDEERLASVLKARLEEEYRSSLEEHGDLVTAFFVGESDGT